MSVEALNNILEKVQSETESHNKRLTTIYKESCENLGNEKFGVMQNLSPKHTEIFKTFTRISNKMPPQFGELMCFFCRKNLFFTSTLGKHIEKDHGRCRDCGKPKAPGNGSCSHKTVSTDVPVPAVPQTYFYGQQQDNHHLFGQQTMDTGGNYPLMGNQQRYPSGQQQDNHHLFRQQIMNTGGNYPLMGNQQPNVNMYNHVPDQPRFEEFQQQEQHQAEFYQGENNS